MAPKLSLQNVLAAQQDMELQLASLHEVQRDLLEQLNATQSGWIRLNLAQVNQQIEDVTLQLASINRQVKEKYGSKTRSKVGSRSARFHSTMRDL